MLFSEKSRHDARRLRRAAYIFLSGLVFFLYRHAFAGEVYDLTEHNPLPSLSFTRLFCTAANWVVTIGLALVIVIIAIAGIRFITSRGDEARRRLAKSTLSDAIMGFLALFFAKVIIMVILAFVGLPLTSMTC